MIPVRQFLLGVFLFLPAAWLPGDGLDDSEPVRHIFSGDTLDLCYMLLPAFTDEMHLEADLYAVSDRLVAPLARNVRLSTDTESASSCLGGQSHFSCILPGVDLEANLLLLPRLILNQHSDAISLPPVRIHVYPRNLLDPLRSYAAEQPLSVGPNSPRLKAWLQKENIRFKSVSPGPTGQFASDGLILIETDLDSGSALVSAPTNNQVILLFFPDVSGIPRMIVKSKGAGTVLEIKLPILDTLDTDPLSQETFVEIIQTARSHLYSSSNTPINASTEDGMLNRTKP